MNTVTVTASKTYDIRIGSGLLATVGAEISALGGVERVCVVSDSNVYPLFGALVSDSLTKAGLSISSFVFPAGEAQKNGVVFLELLNHLATQQLTRSDCLVALGGGVVGDLAGFAAACYLRGIRFVQLPTTLLAAVDSSVGGKTGVDLPQGKNLAGCFHQPIAVVYDTDTLATLPARERRAGMAEVIKYGVLGDEAFFDALAAPDGMEMETLIARCVAMKRDIVEADEREGGERRLLNLGHTVGHAIERCGDYQIAHGEAVAIGMAVITRAAVRRGLCESGALPRLLAALERYDLPTETDYSAADIAAAALADKKMEGATARLIVPERIGRCRVLAIPAEELGGWMKDGGLR